MSESGDDALRVSVIIPTYNGADHLRRLLPTLASQTLLPAEVVVVDSGSTDDSASVCEKHGAKVTRIPKAEFGHGKTRNLAANLAKFPILVFMTQDAVPTNSEFLEKLVNGLRTKGVVACYARQVPRADAIPTDVYLRESNYGPTSSIRRIGDLPRLGIKTFFFSNAASAYDREIFRRVGGFPEDVIQNEDMLLTAKLLRYGHEIAYVADAAVYHSHNYGLVQQFRRYFDIGVAIERAGPLLAGAKAGGAGLRYLLGQTRYFVRSGHWHWIPYGLAESGVKFLAFHLGRLERFIPCHLKRRLSMHSYFWNCTPRRTERI